MGSTWDLIGGLVGDLNIGKACKIEDDEDRLSQPSQMAVHWPPEQGLGNGTMYEYSSLVAVH